MLELLTLLERYRLLLGRQWHGRTKKKAEKYHSRKFHLGLCLLHEKVLIGYCTGVLLERLHLFHLVEFFHAKLFRLA